MLKHSMACVWILVALFAAVAMADSYVITDPNGGPLGRLPYMNRGDKTLIPLSLLARKAGWTAEVNGPGLAVQAPTARVAVRAGNAFAMTDGRCVQMSLVPEEWDGSLWLPTSDLPLLFGDGVIQNSVTGAIQVKKVVHSAEPAVPTAPKDKSGRQWTIRNVIIDAGHGGKDPGAKGLYDLEEKVVTLDIAKRLARLLEGEDIPCKLTRSDDSFHELHERTKFANENEGDLFVSLHCNSFHDTNIKGVETYFLKPAKSERAIEAAMRENSVVKLESGSADYQDLTEDNFILLTMATSQYMKDSESWAAGAVRNLTETTGLESRGADQAGFYVLMGASMPAILVECGYLTNPDDAKLLASERGRQKVAQAIHESIKKAKFQIERSASR